MEYSIVYAEDFHPLPMDERLTTFNTWQGAYFTLAYMENSYELTVIRTDEDGGIYHRNGVKWERVA